MKFYWNLSLTFPEHSTRCNRQENIERWNGGAETKNHFCSSPHPPHRSEWSTFQQNLMSISLSEQCSRTVELPSPCRWSYSYLERSLFIMFLAEKLPSHINGGLVLVLTSDHRATIRKRVCKGRVCLLHGDVHPPLRLDSKLPILTRMEDPRLKILRLHLFRRTPSPPRWFGTVTASWILPFIVSRWVLSPHVASYSRSVGCFFEQTRVLNVCVPSRRSLSTTGSPKFASRTIWGRKSLIWALVPNLLQHCGWLRWSGSLASLIQCR